jgi:hypothetical protein
MSELGFLKYTYLAHLSQPAADRVIYRTLREQPARRILEIGIGEGVRTQRLIEMSAAQAAGGEICYAGIDLFEDRPAESPGLTFKTAFKTLRSLPARVQLIPGDPWTALDRVANSLHGLDLIVISADQPAEALERSWIYFPRMMHAQTLVFREQGQAKQRQFTLLRLPDLERLATQSRRRSRAA